MVIRKQPALKPKLVIQEIRAFEALCWMLSRAVLLAGSTGSRMQSTENGCGKSDWLAMRMRFFERFAPCWLPAFAPDCEHSTELLLILEICPFGRHGLISGVLVALHMTCFGSTTKNPTISGNAKLCSTPLLARADSRCRPTGCAKASSRSKAFA